MSIFEKIKDTIFPKDFDDEEMGYIDEEAFDEPEAPKSAATPVRAAEPKMPVYARPSENAGVAMVSRSSIEMKVVTPTKFEAVTQIADLLLEKKTVLLNLENTNKETAKRLIDFLSGVAYALNGDVQKVADNTFAVTPNNVAVSNEPMEAVTEYEPEGDIY